MPASLPLEDVRVNTVTTRKKDTVEIEYTIDFKSTATWSGVVYRELVGINNEYRYEFPGFYRSYTAGEYSRTRTLLMPSNAPPGRYMLKTFIIWHPILSLKEHVSEVPDSVFTICRNIGKCTESLDRE